MPSRPTAWLDACLAAHARLEALVDNLPDDVARRPSLLDNWTVAHVLTHLARNADSHTGIVEAAQRGETVPQYAGGAEQRNRDIEAGWRRPAAALVEDVRAAQARLASVWAATDEETWATGCGLRRQGPTSLADLVAARWQETEIHLVDLGLADRGGPTWDDLPDAFVDREWINTLTALGPRVPDGLTILLVPGDRPSRAAGSGPQRVVVRAPARRLLQWLVGRGGDPSWPQLGPWFY
jgi:maleylpyruvate isomerase